MAIMQLRCNKQIIVATRPLALHHVYACEVTSYRSLTNQITRNALAVCTLVSFPDLPLGGSGNETIYSKGRFSTLALPWVVDGQIPVYCGLSIM